KESPRTEDSELHRHGTPEALEKGDGFGSNPSTCTMHARALLIPSTRPCREGPSRWGGRGVIDARRNQNGTAGGLLRGSPARGERGGHPDAHLEQHSDEGRAGDRIRGRVDGGRNPGFRRAGRPDPRRRGDDEQREPPRPPILRMEVRNPNNTIPDEVTVYAGCGAEEVVSG